MVLRVIGYAPVGGVKRLSQMAALSVVEVPNPMRLSAVPSSSTNVIGSSGLTYLPTELVLSELLTGTLCKVKAEPGAGLLMRAGLEAGPLMFMLTGAQVAVATAVELRVAVTVATGVQ